MTIDVKKCPICNRINNCGNEQSIKPCWCSQESFPKEIFELVPEEKRNKACICKTCLEKFKNSIN